MARTGEVGTGLEGQGEDWSGLDWPERFGTEGLVWIALERQE